MKAGSVSQVAGRPVVSLSEQVADFSPLFGSEVADVVTVDDRQHASVDTEPHEVEVSAFRAVCERDDDIGLHHRSIP